VVESRAEPHRRIWLYDHAADGRLSNKRLYVDAQGPGAYDGIAVDALGNVWCGFGSSGGAQAAELDGVRVYDPSGKAIGHIHLPSAAPTCASAARRTTACSWRRAIRSMRCS